ncbi:MAG: hypothetical protein WBO04_01280 [Steroidobacteraceae bacterium]
MLALGLAAVPAGARETPTGFTVSVSVAPRASLDVFGLPGRLPLSDEDVARGYLDFVATCRVRSNDPRGYILRLVPRTGPTRAIEVRGLGEDMVLGEDSVEIHRPAAGKSQALEFRVRLVLDPRATAGTYAMPLQLDVSTT